MSGRSHRTRVCRRGAIAVLAGLPAPALAQAMGNAGESAGALRAETVALIGAIILVPVLLVAIGVLARARSAGLRDLAGGEARYRLLAAHTSEVVLSIDADGRIRFASPAASRTGLWREGELAGCRLVELATGDQRAALASILSEAPGRVATATWHEVTLVGPRGDEQWFDLRVEPSGEGDDATRGETVVVLRSIAERKALENQLYEAGLTDPQTGLANRRAFMAMLEHHLAEHSGGCLALFDLDHFRAFNDRHGHATGDKVLALFANLVRSLVRGGDTVARIGGEKFGVLLPGATPEQAEAVVSRVLAALSGTTRAIDDAIVRVSASAGVAQLGGSADDALRSADLALQVAKAKGRDRLELAPLLRIGRPSRW